MPIETKCSSISGTIHIGNPFYTRGDLMFFTPGPFEEILKMKALNQPYTLQRFRVYGNISVSISGWFTVLTMVAVSYLGRGGKEIGIDFTATQHDWGKRVDLSIDKYLDVYSEFRGLGVQAIKVVVVANWTGDVTVTGNICYDLTWVG